MTLADSLKPSLRAIRAIPGELGLRPHRAYLRRKTFPGENDLQLTVSITETELVEGNSQPPKIRQLGDERRALSGLAAGSVEIGPCTTSGTDGGVTFGELLGSALASDELLQVRISGPIGEMVYAIKGATLDRAMHYRIVCEPVSAVSPDE